MTTDNEIKGTFDAPGTTIWATIRADQLVPGDNMALITEWGRMVVEEAYLVTRRNRVLVIGELTDHHAAGQRDYVSVKADDQVGIFYTITEGNGWSREAPGEWTYSDAWGVLALVTGGTTGTSWEYRVVDPDHPGGNPLATGLHARLPEAQRAVMSALEQLKANRQDRS
ncbi:hypothetical protein SEA_TYPHA_114 [Mycobacterium phage Typha]|uniref:Uncharacterized protein n=1 Tax=Mycobacterium phage Typha TaxID=2517971 RepID=A0A482JC23_9CAUD|nr:hypothetical protein KCH40_gp055 [Mycobacterium phage Typha]QBP29769.1 hypothetical protein SEA_TYPHA_114 [Mycobacterium phage Typha]URM86555.1 hypothetical protein PBI_HILLTOPFARM_117 [Mycobacterium phage Hilltopfarm]